MTRKALVALVVVEERKAQLWINHDQPQSERLRHAPAY